MLLYVISIKVNCLPVVVNYYYNDEQVAAERVNELSICGLIDQLEAISGYIPGVIL